MLKAKVWTEAELDRKAEAAKRCGTRPTGRWRGTGWTADQVALLGTDDDDAVAVRTGRTAGAVRSRRTKLGIPAFRDSRRGQAGRDPGG